MCFVKMEFGKIDSKTQFSMLMRRKQELDTVLKEKSPVQKGALDFVAYKLNKERDQVKQDLARLSFRFTPDTIA